MDRRQFVGTALSATALWSTGAQAKTLTYEDILTRKLSLAEILQDVAADPTIVEDGWQFQDRTVSRGVGTGTPSKRILSRVAKDFIIAFEVASPAAYEKRYRKPIWPKGVSGVTIGVGYDLRFANKSFVDRDWPMLSQADRTLLYGVVGLSGVKAKDALPSVQAVEIHWPDANTQFEAFLPYPTKQTEDAFANCDVLPDSAFGALVSLIYNRGPKISKNSQSRIEMYEIQQMMKAKTFGLIPDRIRSMKRVWKDDPNARGLLLRREAEAQLFEKDFPPGT